MNAAKTIIPKNLPRVNGHPQIVDITGLKFNRWTVISFVEGEPKMSKWLCECECGNRSNVDGGALKHGNSKSCGCLRNEKASARLVKRRKTKKFFPRLTHGQTRGGVWSNEYGIWSAMKERVFNPKVESYKYYGARGIKIDPRWMKFENFIADMGLRPTKNHSIERINNNGNYESDNCKWATRREQSYNTRRTKIVFHKGKSMTLFELSTISGISRQLLYGRIFSKGWSVERAIETKPRWLKLRVWSK